MMRCVDRCNNCWRLCKKHHKIFILVFFVLFGSLSLASDWLFYYGLCVTKEGLVYGPVKTEAVKAMFGFCIIGSIIFVLDVISHVYSLCWGFKNYQQFLNTDLFSFLAILFGDIPQVSISVYVANCREEGSSPFQFTKAAFVSLGESIYDDTRAYLETGSWSGKCVCLLVHIYTCICV